MIGKDAFNPVEAYCRPDLETLKRDCIQNIKMMCVSAPVLVFGLDDMFNEIKMEFTDAPVMKAITKDEVTDLKSSAPELNNGIYFIHFDWHFGVDFRFKMTPHSIAFCRNATWDNYTILQIAGHAQRALQRSTCKVYKIGSMQSARQFAMEINTVDPHPFLDGP